MTMTTTEKLIALDAKEQKVVRDKPLSVVYPTRSGTKDLKTKYNIGGNFTNLKKVARQPLQIYQGKEFLKNINKGKDLVKSSFVNPTRVPKIDNTDTKPVMTQGVKKVYGMILMGGKGIEYAEGFIQKLEEMKLNKMTFLQEDV